MVYKYEVLSLTVDFNMYRLGGVFTFAILKKYELFHVYEAFVLSISVVHKLRN